MFFSSSNWRDTGREDRQRVQAGAVGMEEREFFQNIKSISYKKGLPCGQSLFVLKTRCVEYLHIISRTEHRFLEQRSLHRY